MRFFGLGLLILAGVITTAGTASPQAVYLGQRDGGLVGEHVDEFARYAATGNRIVITMPCTSACITALAFGGCVAGDAWIRPHAVSIPDGDGVLRYNRKASQQFLSMFPRDLRRAIRRHGGLQPEPTLLRREHLPARYRC